jgi:sn-glycerol 3-phosphate transport system ATP-binding protein
LRNRRTPKAEIERRVHKAAAMLEIEPFLARKPKALSGGQRQRVAMGRALVREPAAFLFDEPLSNLDAKLRVQMRVEIRQLQRQLGTTSLYVTHDQHEAMTLADRLVVLNGGRIEQQGTPMTIYDRPDSLFVAGFIGSPGMNLMDLSVIRAGVSAEVQFPPGTDIVGVRPEDLTTIVPDVPCVTIDGRVELFEPSGHEALLYLSVPGLRTAVVALTGVRDLVAPGATVRLFARCDAVHPFYSTTGRRTD